MGSGGIGPPPEMQQQVEGRYRQQAADEMLGGPLRQAVDQQAAADQQLLAQQTQANRPNQVTPWGSSTWAQGPDGQWTQNVNLTPQSQQALDSQMAVQTGRSQLAEGMLGRAGNAYANPMDWGALPGMANADQARQQAIDAAYGQAQSRLDPQWQQREEAMRSQLLNQGFREGDEGYRRAMDDLARQRTDAYQTAQNAATLTGQQAAQSQFGMGLQGRQQGLSEMLQQRSQPLNELNALLSGQQVGTPDMPGFAQAGRAQAPDYLRAALGQYGIMQDNSNANQMLRQRELDTFGGILGGLGSIFGF